MSVSKEEWRPIEGYEGLYEVSNLGRVRKRVWKEIKGTAFHGNYRRVNLNDGEKQESVLVHRLVARAFIPNPNGYSIINHIDECPANNRADNLEWCDQKHNMSCGTVPQRESESSPNKSAIMSIDKHTGEKEFFNCISDAYKAVGKNRTGSISEAANGKRKSAYGRYWYFVGGNEDECE